MRLNGNAKWSLTTDWYIKLYLDIYNYVKNVNATSRRTLFVVTIVHLLCFEMLTRTLRSTTTNLLIMFTYEYIYSATPKKAILHRGIQ